MVERITICTVVLLHTYSIIDRAFGIDINICLRTNLWRFSQKKKKKKKNTYVKKACSCYKSKTNSSNLN